jgi:acetylornithine deacetylase/succinyl-diaminopimelate desuccinylase-like protein
MNEEFDRLGLKTRTHEFRFNDNLYANLLLHFGMGNVGTLLSPAAPLLAFALHLTAATSYWADSTRRAYMLRRIFPWKPSRNVLGVLPAEGGKPALRVVIMAHVDAAFTGWMFKPSLLTPFTARMPQRLKFLERGLTVATYGNFLLAGADLLRVFFGPLVAPLRPLEYLVNLPGLLTTLLNVQLVLKNQIVPGANDDLSGVAALPVLAQRLAMTKRADVEIVVAATGCEEASLGGADSLVRDMEGEWSRDNTVFVVLDAITNGQLHYLGGEGEIVRTPLQRWLVETVAEVAASEPRFRGVGPFSVPIGGSDAAACLAHGWDAVCLCCVDPTLGSPRHYHLPSDTLENLEMDQLMDSIDFAEKLVQAIVRRRLGP